MFFIKNAIDAYKKTFCYKGVAGRKSYILFALFQFLFLVLLRLITFLDYVAIIVGLLPLFVFLAGLAITVRRFHDFGLSGWWAILYFGVTFVVPIVLIIFVILAFFSFTADLVDGSYTAAYVVTSSIVRSTIEIYVVCITLSMLLALPKSKIENNKYRPADSISTPATDEAVS
ncbi:DUF805 domain-containing protein [Buttiauxella sp. 3AFRM03]|uniref:DUF805 domain-containing protein n=1 Tax=Buttiauxella sp. 3AFRM03 TaxID=2479367 RepID=UPI000EF77308|nr:DUF805 domain-containing protein [Buttiauxella sp. 3AFRM03]AYN27018.1 DUF805 domain-containing protein [Buttiauxella sp. 3AFRM03]